jgi:ParB family transcriptional regulator, chromosome partitioning protein
MRNHCAAINSTTECLQSPWILLTTSPIGALPNTSQFLLVKVSEVKVRTRLRGSNEENIEDIAESIKEIGLINPISIDSDWNLIAGYHRLQAYKILGIEEIPAIISNQQELKARLQEIDENLKRAELTAIEKSIHIEERENILRQLNRMSVKGDNRFSGAGKSTQTQRAGEIGMSRRNYQYHKELENLHPEVKDLLNDTQFSSRLMDLVMLSRENDDIQLRVANALITGKVFSVKRALVIEKTKVNRIASPYMDGLPDFKGRYGEIPKSIMNMGKPIDDGMKALWDLAANNEELRTTKKKMFFGTSSLRLYSWNPNHCAFLIDYYTQMGDWILDPFVGRGSTAIAALMLKRNFIGIDILEEITSHNQQILSEHLDIPDVQWSIHSEDGIALQTLLDSETKIDGVITDPPYYEKAEVYSNDSLDLSVMPKEEYNIKIHQLFANLREIVKPSLLGSKNRIHPAIFKLGSYRRGKQGLVDMATDYQAIAEECGWVLWDKSFTSLNSALQSLTFQRNYANGYLTKNYETILVFVWFEA